MRKDEDVFNINNIYYYYDIWKRSWGGWMDR
jgi:cellulase/cellobiase CelA1